MIIAGIKLLKERERIYKGRFEELKREIMVGVEASEGGEVIEGDVVFRQLERNVGYKPFLVRYRNSTLS